MRATIRCWQHQDTTCVCRAYIRQIYVCQPETVMPHCELSSQVNFQRSSWLLKSEVATSLDAASESSPLAQAPAVHPPP